MTCSVLADAIESVTTVGTVSLTFNALTESDSKTQRRLASVPTRAQDRPESSSPARGMM